MSYVPPLPEPPPPPPGSAVAEPPPPEPAGRSRKPLVVAAMVVLALGLGFSALATWLSAPGRCDAATYTSEQFGYCVAAPSGWSAEKAKVGQAQVDRFLQPDGSAAVYVQAVALQEGQGSLPDFVDYVRGLQQQEGFSLTTASDTEVDGVNAASWDVTSSTETGETRMREVVFVRGDTAWRVQFADSPQGFDQHSAEFQQMLDSFHFA
jgi:photosystem II reaction center protein PsbP